MIKETNIDKNHIITLRQELGAQIKEKRWAANMDQKTLADTIGVHSNTIIKMEAGIFPTPIDLYIKIGVVLNFKINLV